MNEAFEEAFYQLDQDRDGVVTIADLERYAAEKNLKENFTKKWLSLFADKKNIIYYDKFCQTLGIVPAREKLKNKVYEVDMTPETQAVVMDTIGQFQKDDGSLPEKFLKDIKHQLADKNGGKWKIKLNPKDDDVNVKYGEDGLLYYSPHTSKDLNILVYKVPEVSEKSKPEVYKVDMTDKTKANVTKVISDVLDKDNKLSPNLLEQIKNKISSENGGKWDMKLNPNEKDLMVKYDKDGLLYYSPDATGETKILVWKCDPKDEFDSPVIYECDMLDKVKENVLKEFYENFNNDGDNEIKKEIILNELEKQFGKTWNLEINPTKKQIDVKSDYDGKIYFAPNKKEDVKILLWKEDKTKKRGVLCCCGCF